MKLKSTLALLSFAAFILSISGCKNRNAGLSFEKNCIIWNSDSGYPVKINPPAISTDKNIVFSLVIDKSIITTDSADITYRISTSEEGKMIEGLYNLKIAIPKSADDYITQKSTISFSDTIYNDITVTNSYDIINQPAIAMICENMELTGNIDWTPAKSVIYTKGLTAHSIKSQQAAYFEMGYNSTDTTGYVLSMPVVGFSFKTKSQGQLVNLSVSADPYSGTQFYGKNENNQTHITLESRYSGSIVPLKEETKTIVLEFTKNDPDHIINSFYKTIPDVEAAPAWVHDIAMAYYDYNGDDGKGWYRDIEKMAEKCPAEQRNKIAVCIHGWYNNTGWYCYDIKTDKLLDEWKAFANPHPADQSKKKAIPMSKKEMHNRIKFAKDKGFRVILYYSDGTNCTGSPDFHKGQVFKYKNDSVKYGWVGPDGGGPSLDPTCNETQGWYKKYLSALLKEFGKELDGFVYDETNYFMADDVSYRIRTNPQYADRAMMQFVKDLTMQVQNYRKINPNLVIMEGSHYFYGLVMNGSFTDMPGLPTIINYRNASWTCSWNDPGIRNVQTFFRTRKDIKYPYGLDIGLSNGWNTDKGPFEMDPKVLDQVFQHFLERVKEGPQSPKIKKIDGLDELL
jgi:hypothetical protein